MDDYSIGDTRIDDALIELKTINKLLGGNASSQKGLDILLKEHLSINPITILDAGSGSSDILLSLKYINRTISIFSLDINLRACKYALRNSSELKSICGNAGKVPFKNSTFDLVHASLFLHHFKDDELKRILYNLLSAARYGVIINDLRRSWFAFIGIKILTQLFSKSDMVKNDGPLSVRRGFVKKELITILEEMNIKRFSIKRRWAFRWLVVIYK